MHDEVQKELHKEDDVIQRIRKFLSCVLEQSQEQVRKLKSILYHMNFDLEDKEHNLKIHQNNINLKESYLDLSIHLRQFEHNS